jgi:hypothetical protein
LDWGEEASMLTKSQSSSMTSKVVKSNSSDGEPTSLGAVELSEWSETMDPSSEMVDACDSGADSSYVTGEAGWLT